MVRFRCTASFQALLKSWRAVLKLLKDIFYKTVWFRSGGLWFTQCCCLQFLFSIPTPRRGAPVSPYTRQKLREAPRWAQHQLVHGSGPVQDLRDKKFSQLHLRLVPAERGPLSTCVSGSPWVCSSAALRVHLCVFELPLCLRLGWKMSCSQTRK